MSGYKVGDLSQLLQTAGSSLPQSGGSFLTTKKPVKPSKAKKQDNASISEKSDKQLTKQEEKSSSTPEKKAKKRKRKAGKENSDNKTDVKPGDSKPDLKTTEKDKTTENVEESKPPKKKKKKAKAKADEANTATEHQPGYNPPAGIVHESVTAKEKEKDSQKDSQTKSSKKRKQEDSDLEEEDIKSKKSKLGQEKSRMRRDRLKKKTENRTIFIGNLPISVKKKRLLKMFKEFGEIESVRYRCLPVNDPSVPKKVIAIKGELHPERHNCVAYVCFMEEESAKKALSQNGEEVEGLHIRVDMAGKKDKSNNKTSVFVGNLPYNMEEEALREHFEDCGTIENVRIVRDRQTCIGKGFGYIKFSDTDGVSFATKLNGSSLKKRTIRVMPCVAKPKQSAKGDKDKTPAKGKKNFAKPKPGGKMSTGKPGKHMDQRREGKDGKGFDHIFDDDSDIKQKHGKFKDKGDKKSRKNFKGRDGKPKKKSFRPSNMKKTPFHNKLVRKDSKKPKQKKQKT